MKTIVSIILGLFITYQSFSQKMSEILGRPTDNSITMNIMFDSQVDVYFEYGTIKGNYPNSTPVSTCKPNEPVEIDMTGLQAATRYNYRTRYRKTGESTYQASPEHTFITQRKPGSTFSFTVEADPHYYDKKGNWNLWDICLANQLKDTADFMIDMGDTFGDDREGNTKTNEQIKLLQLGARNFFAKVCHSLPFYFCIGNHEGECGYYLTQTPPNNMAVYETLWRKLYYPNPYPNSFYTGSNAEEGYGMGKAENYFAWEWGDALFVILDVYRYATANEKPQKWDFTIGKVQYDWFKQTLEKSTAKYKFVFAHHILGQGRGGIELATSFEWGGYDAGTYKFDTYRPGWGLPLHQLMKQNKVDIFFQGHDHIYVHQELDGVTYQSLQMPSDSTYTIASENSDAYLTGKQLPGSGHLRVTVAPDSVTVEFVNAMLPRHETGTRKNGDILDSYSIVKKSGTTSINQNSALSLCTVYPNPSGDEVNISFNQAVDKNLIIQIINIEGKVVKHIERTGSNLITMKLMDDNGNKLKTGIYVIKVIGDRGNVVYRKLAVR